MKQFITILAALFVAIPTTFAQRFIRAVDSLAALNATPASSASPDIYVTGANGGFFRWTAGSSAATNAYNVLANPYGSGVGRWIRQQATGGTINLGAAGLTFDGGTYDYPFIAQNMSAVGIDGTTAQLTGLTDLTLDGQRDLTIFGRTNFYLWTPRVWNQTAPNNATLRLIDSTTGKADFVLMDVDSVAALKAVPAAFYANGATFRTLGYYSAGDGGGAMYRYDAASVATGNDGTVITPTHGAGRMIYIGENYPTAKQWGLRGNGSTDDSARMTAAVNALNSGAVNKLKFTAGTYVLRDDWELSGNGIVLEGDGWGSVLRSDASDGVNNWLFRLSGTNVVIRDLTLMRGANTNPASGWADQLMQVRNSLRHFTLQGCKIDGGMSGAVARAGYYYVEMRASGLTNDAPRFIQILNNYWTDTGNRALDLRGVRDVVIDGNQFWNCGINIPGGNPGTCVEVQSYDVANGAWSFNVTISNNTFQRWGDGAINIGGCEDTSITGNVMHGASLFGQEPLGIEENGIAVLGGKRISIANNSVSFVRSSGIQVRTQVVGGTYNKDLHDAVIAGNTLRGGQSPFGTALETSIQVYGINSGTTLRNVSVVGNAFSHSLTNASGIAISSSGGTVDGVTVSGNALRGGSSSGTGYGVSISNSTGTFQNLTVSGNTITEFGTGLFVPSAMPTRTMIIGNSFGNCTVRVSNGTTADLTQESGYIGIRTPGSGTSFASSGTFRGPNSGSLAFRNAADNGNVTAISVDSDNAVVVGTRFSVNPVASTINISSAGMLAIGAASTQTVSNSQTVSVTSTALRLTGGTNGAVTLNTTNALSAPTQFGQVLFLIGMDNTNTVTINDGGNMYLQGNRTLGEGDILHLMYMTGANAGWREIGYSNN